MRSCKASSGNAVPQTDVASLKTICGAPQMRRSSAIRTTNHRQCPGSSKEGPTSTGAAKAVGVVLPELQGLLHGIASRVPVPDGSVVDLFVKLSRTVSVEEVDRAIRAAAESPRLTGILQYSERPLVSTDVIGNSHSSIYDSGFTAVTGGRYLRVLNWYDNEWGYSCRVIDVLAMMHGF